MRSSRRRASPAGRSEPSTMTHAGYICNGEQLGPLVTTPVAYAPGSPGCGFFAITYEGTQENAIPGKEFTMRKIKIGDSAETVVERADYPPERIKGILAKETVAVLGYGVQGRGQSLNMKDNGVNVIIGMREQGKGWDLAQQDGWVPGQTLFPMEEAARRGTIVQYLLSDAGQKEQWPVLKPLLTPGKALYFSHGFSIAYSDLTGVVPPKDIDVILVAPKGSGTTVRRHFLEGRGINASYAVYQDATGRALERALATGIAIGSGYLFETTFQKEVYSDLTGERGVLMGAIYGLWLAQYEVLRERGHSPSEAFNETVEEATQSLYPLIAENGMD